MKISILISNYNKEKYIEECILSSLNQDYKNLEIIVFDNNSTDNSLKIINKFSEKILIKKKNRISEFASFNQIDLINYSHPKKKQRFRRTIELYPQLSKKTTTSLYKSITLSFILHSSFFI